MRVLCTGGHGFIGTAVMLELSRRGMTAVSFDAPDDIRDRTTVMGAVAGVDAVINLAGVLGTSETIGLEFTAAYTNILGALNVMDACVTKPLVQIATGHEGQPNPYAITKKCATDLALSRAQWNGQKITVVRAYHVYGPGQKMCPPHGQSSVAKIVPSFVARALTGMNLKVNGSGMQLIDLVYLDDVAKVLVDALKGPYGEVVEAGTGRPTSVLHAAQTIITHCGSKSRIEHVPMRKGEPPSTLVYAQAPLCHNNWPYRLPETVAWYSGKLTSRVAA